MKNEEKTSYMDKLMDADNEGGSYENLPFKNLLLYGSENLPMMP